jgi:hypothetical protein
MAHYLVDRSDRSAVASANASSALRERRMLPGNIGAGRPAGLIVQTFEDR